MDSNIFDLENISDLGENVTSQLKVSSISKNDRKILDLFEIKNTLSIDEIIVGLARKYELSKERSWVSNRLYSLSKSRKLEKIKGKKGIYRLINNK